MFKYRTKNGIISIEVGNQNFDNMTVEVIDEDKSIVLCNMKHEPSGDYSFKYKGETIYFHHNIK